MYEHERAQLRDDMQVAQARAAAAQAQADVAANDLAAARAGVDGAQVSVSRATANADTTRAALTAAQNEQTRRAQGLVAAQAALDAWAGDEPESTLPNGKPAPGWGMWRARGAGLKAALQNAQSAATAAAAAAAAAQSAATAALADLSSAQRGLAAAQTRLDGFQHQLTSAQAAVAAAQQRRQAVADRIDELDARQARILTEPPDRAELTSIADQEQVAIQSLRHDRRQLMTDRKGLRDQRAAVLAAHDAAMDATGLLATEMTGWSDPDYPEPRQQAAALRPQVAASLAGRALPSGRRTDDLTGTAATLAAAADALQASAARASGARDAAAARLQIAIDTVNTVASDAP